MGRSLEKERGASEVRVMMRCQEIKRLCKGGRQKDVKAAGVFGCSLVDNEGSAHGAGVCGEGAETRGARCTQQEQQQERKGKGEERLMMTMPQEPGWKASTVSTTAKAGVGSQRVQKRKGMGQ